MTLARIDTLIGAVLCQAISIAIIVAAAATLGKSGHNLSLDNIAQIGDAFAGVLGTTFGLGIFAVGLCGAATVATVVICLALAWTIGEIAGVRDALNRDPAQAPWFYAVFGLLLALGGFLVTSGINLIRLSVAVGVINALLLPSVLGFVFMLARYELPESLRLKSSYAVLVGILFGLTAGLGLYAGIVGALG